MKVITVIGARPQFIKAAAVSNAFFKVGGVEEILLHTGQHYDQNMSDIFFDELGIPVPKYNLGVGGGQHGAMTGAQLAGIVKALDYHTASNRKSFGDDVAEFDNGTLDAKGKRVVVAAHGNSIRALVKYLDNISDNDIVGLNIPNGIPLVYELDDNLKPIRHYYLGDAEAAAKAAAAVASQGKA